MRWEYYTRGYNGEDNLPAQHIAVYPCDSESTRLAHVSAASPRSVRQALALSDPRSDFRARSDSDSEGVGLPSRSKFRGMSHYVTMSLRVTMN